MPDYNAFERICAEAVGCNRCFPKIGVVRASVNLAQPRYVGPNYWSSKERRLLLTINPGAGDDSPSNQDMRRDLISYRDQDISLEQLFERQRAHFPRWSRGKFLTFVEKLSESLDCVALLNVAWCSTRGNKYPPKMLKTCFAVHTRRALEALQPTKIVACGSEARRFMRGAGIPFGPAPHYAARFAIDYEALRQHFLECAKLSGAIAPEAVVSALDEYSRGKAIRSSSESHRDPHSRIIRLLVRTNPKMPTSKSFLRFACYRDGMTTAEYRMEVILRLGPAEAGKSRSELRYDVAHHFIRIVPN